MIPPKHYSDWMKYYDLLKDEREEFYRIVEVLEKGTLEWTPGVAEKIINETFKVIEYKLKQITQAFHTELNNANGEEHYTVAAIMNAKNKFNGVKRIGALSVFPQDVSKTLLEVVNKYVDDSQQSLIASAKEDRTGYFSSIVKHNKLTDSSLVGDNELANQNDSSSQTPNFKPGRRVLF